MLARTIGALPITIKIKGRGHLFRLRFSTREHTDIGAFPSWIGKSRQEQYTEVVGKALPIAWDAVSKSLGKA
jgi:hypothetical protein